MSTEDASKEFENSAEAVYASQFLHHLAEVQAHLIGKADSDLLPSYIPPTGYWTISEKDAFFRALSVHSRLRPDLIAACVGTKNVLDVCIYIDALDEALALDQHPLSRARLEGAMEVSDTWVEWEESRAEALVSLEARWEDAILAQRHEDEIASKLTISQTARDAGGDVDDFQDHDLQIWESEKRVHWSQENALKRLTPAHLRVLEGILKESECIDLDKPNSEDQSQCLTTLHPTLQTSSRNGTVVNSTVDPEQLRASELAISNLPPETVPSDYHEENSLLSTTTQSASRGDKRWASTTHASHGPFSETPCTPEVDGELSQLSPASRRRLQKRLYMRRKRASHTGETVVVAAEKLRPGRKVNEKKPPRKPRAKRVAPQGDEGSDNSLNSYCASNPSKNTFLPSSPHHHPPEDDVDEKDKRAASLNKGGLTKHYKIKRGFTSKGINAKTLVDGNLELFHHSALSRFMMYVQILRCVVELSAEFLLW